MNSQPRYADASHGTSNRKITRIRSQGNEGSFSAKIRIYPVIFRGKISLCGMILILLFLRRIEFKRVKNNLQGFREYLYPWGV
jgi:hypothetical protein